MAILSTRPPGSKNMAAYVDSHLQEIRALKEEGKFSSEELRELSKLRGAEQEKVLQDVRTERITCDEAEAWALRRGEEPFARHPDLRRFDPIEEPYWTLAMALAWIIWRSCDAVIESWSDYRRECRVWGKWSPHQIGWDLARRQPVNRALVLNLAIHGDASIQVKDPIASIKEFDAALQSGDLEGFGIPSGEIIHADAPIPKHQWLDLSYSNDSDLEPDSVFARSGTAPQYSDVRVLRREVMKNWPPKSLIDARAAILSLICNTIALGWAVREPLLVPKMPTANSPASANMEQIREIIRNVHRRAKRESSIVPSDRNMVHVVQAVLRRSSLVAHFVAIQRIAKKMPSPNKLTQGRRVSSKNSSLRVWTDADTALIEPPTS